MAFDIDEIVDIANWKSVLKYKKIRIRLATEADLDEIFELIQCVGKEMESKNDALFAYSKTRSTYLEMLNTGVCAVAVNDNAIVASLLTRPADNMPETLEFVTCQVLPSYRGNRLEQQLIDYVVKNSKNYAYAICTVHPENHASLKSVQNCGFEICSEAYLYGGKRRFVLMKSLYQSN